MQTSSTELLTLEAYAALERPEDQWVTELVRGRLVCEPRPGAPHARVQFELARLLGNWAHEHGQGAVYGESGFILSEEPPTVRGPDVAVVLRPHSWRGEVGQWIRGAPELAVEILSPSDLSTDVQQKVLEYLEAGARLVWIVDPEAATVTVYRSDGTASLLRNRDVLDGEDVLPRFSVVLSKLFRPTPTTRS